MTPATPVPEARLAHRVFKERPARREALATPDPRGGPAQLERMVLPGRLARRERRGRQVREAHRVHKVAPAPLDQQDPTEHPVSAATPDRPVRSDHLARPERKVPRVCKVRLAPTATPDRLEPLGPPATLEPLGRLGQLDRPDR